MFMRWIFIVLLVINGVLPLWYFALGSDSRVQLQAARSTYWPPPSDVADIVLLGERSESLDGSVKINAEESPAGQRPELCAMVGPFPAPDAAKHFVERLRALDVLATARAFELRTGLDYWVYFPPEASRQDAYRRLAELQAQGVDSHIILRGELAHGISLGVFSQKTLAEAQVQSVQLQGQTPKIRVIDRSHEEIWVVFGPGEAQKITKSTWWPWLDHRNPFEERQNFCLDLASGQNIL